MGGGVAWLATRELLLAGGTAVTGGIAGLMKRSEVRRVPAIGGAGGEDDTGRNPPTDGHGTRGVGATVAPLGPNGKVA